MRRSEGSTNTRSLINSNWGSAVQNVSCSGVPSYVGQNKKRNIGPRWEAITGNEWRKI